MVDNKVKHPLSDIKPQIMWSLTCTWLVTDKIGAANWHAHLEMFATTCPGELTHGITQVVLFHELAPNIYFTSLFLLYLSSL